MVSIIEKINGIKRVIFRNEGVRDINNVMEYFYMKTLRKTLRIVNGWPGKEIGEPWSQSKNRATSGQLFILHLMFACHIIGMVMFFIKNIDEMDGFGIGATLIFILLFIVYESRLMTTSSMRYKQIVSIFVHELHLFYSKDVSPFAMKIHKQVHQMSHQFLLFILIEIIVGVLAFNSLPMINNYAAAKFKNLQLLNGTFEQSYYMSTPIPSTSVIGYFFICIFNWFIGIFEVLLYYMIDVLLFLIIFHIWGHLKILLYNLNNFPKPAKRELLTRNRQTVKVDFYSAQESKLIQEKLKGCIDHHRFIAKCINNVSDTFGLMLLIYMLFYQITGCLLLFVSSIMDRQQFMRLIQIVTGVFQQLILTSFIFEMIGSTTEKLSDAVYGLPWECMDVKNRKTVFIFLMNVQEPMRLKALGLIDVGVTTMATILKTSFSYFTFLRSMQFSTDQQ